MDLDELPCVLEGGLLAHLVHELLLCVGHVGRFGLVRFVGDVSMDLYVSLVFVLVLRSCSVNRSAMIDARDALMQRSSRESENLGQISVDFGRQMLRIAITYLHMSYIRVDILGISMIFDPAFRWAVEQVRTRRKRSPVSCALVSFL